MQSIDIDKPVSGIVLLARTSKALSRLQALLRGKAFHKVYLAVVEGEVKEQSGTWEDWIVHDERKAKSAPSHPDAKQALLHFKTLAREKGRSFLMILLETGRYHQIRLQFSLRGHPIIGDRLYGSQTTLSQGIALHHEALYGPHPVEKKQCLWTSPSPSYFPFSLSTPL